MCNFSNWFADNYGKLKMRLYSPYFNDDAFHDAYLCALSFANKASDPSMYESIFFAAYKAQNKMRLQESFVNIHPDDFVWGVITSHLIDDDEIVNESNKTLLATKIKRFAKANFSGKEYQIFEAYFLYSLKLENTSNFVGCSVSFVFSHVAKMRQILCKEFGDNLNLL